ncbi:MAG TPA: protein translocase subunit SecD [Myxococcota bacterium]|nr:protein translocase subunit SecD [Myxococcota bacterium]
MTSLRGRIIAIAATLLFFGWYTAINFVPASVRKETRWLPNQGIRLGLDLQGGIHWVLGPDLDVAIEHELDVLRGGLRESLVEKNVTPKRLSIDGRQLIVEAASPEDLAKIRDAVGETKVLREVKADGNTVTFELTERWAKEVRERGMEQMLEVLRKRIDDPIQGVQDSVVTRQGQDRVLIQIPGGQLDRDQARGLLRKTGFLEFKMVLDEAPTEELLRAKHKDGLPPDTEIAFEKEKGTDRVLGAYLVSKSPDLTGEFLTDARSNLDPRYGWVVNFTFNSEGARRFAKLTGDNVGKRLAILLDGQVHSAPNLQTRIGGGRGFIHGRFDSQSAADLAVILRAGSLPIPVQIEEERTIGPALGADSIHKGVQATLLGVALVIAFAVFYYRLSGVYASIALLANVILMLGVLSMAHATLTLPGIAGLVLTAGIAIDANVIIFERIREELRLGKSPRAAIRTGFSKALWTILDANITTLITALILFQYGTGPVKGFAVTLSIGIVTSVFAALVITRLFYDIHPGNRPVSALSI